MSQELESKPSYIDTLRQYAPRLALAGVIALAACSDNTSKVAGTPVRSETPAIISAPAIPSPVETDRPVCDWADRDGKRQQLIKTDPPTVRVDGRCDNDPSAPVGVYPQANQEGKAVDRMGNDETFVVTCVIKGVRIQDLQGRGSNNWLWGTTPRGITGALPGTYAGFPDPEQFKPC